MNPGGFADLRLNQQRQKDAETIWPSFTDIMTVILMIFMTSMVLLLLRNWELVERLQAAVTAERQSKELAETSAKEKVLLGGRVDDLQAQVAMLRMNVLQLEEDVETKASMVERKAEEAVEAQASYRQIQAEFGELQTQFQSRQRDWEERVEGLKKKMYADSSRHRQQVADLERDRDHANAQLSRLQNRYDRLKRPARSSKGKVVVEVAYRRHGRADAEIRLKAPGMAEFSRVDRGLLHRRMKELQAKHPQGLYVKVMFPEDADISHREAWQFTEELLEKYDYYYMTEKRQERA